jgi:hypothetical protein
MEICGYKRTQHRELRRLLLQDLRGFTTAFLPFYLLKHFLSYFTQSHANEEQLFLKVFLAGEQCII